MTITKHIKTTAEIYPHKEAVIFKNKRISYLELEKKTNIIANGLLRFGLKKGDRVGVLMPNCIENILCFISILKIGCIEVNFKETPQLETIINAFRETEISLLICFNISKSNFQELSKNFNILNGLSTLMCTNDDKLSFRDDASDMAIIQYTSGTTGESKGVTLTQQSFINASKDRSIEISLNENSRILNMLSLSHSCGKSLLFDSLLLRATFILTEGFVLPKFLKTIINEKVTIITGPPFIFNYLLKLKDGESIQKIKNHLKYIEVGLGMPSSQLIYDLKQAFPWATIINRYGLTENAGAASYMIFRNSTDLKYAASCGKGTRFASLNIDEKGEVIITGTTLMSGYWNDIKNNQIKDYSQGFFTGDLASKDSNGFFYIKGRFDNIIKIAGEKVVPKYIEDVVLQIQGIDEVAVFGTNDNVIEKKIVVYYVANENKENDIKIFCRRYLPSYMMPHIFVRSAQPLPKNQSGKISKNTLQKTFHI